MIRKQPKGSLADKIVGVLSAVPAQFNPDDDHIDDTTAKLADFDDSNDENDDDEKLLSKFRKQNVDLLADVDKRYAGKKGSRKSLQGDSSEEGSEGSSDTEDYDKEEDFDDDDDDDIPKQIEDDDFEENDEDSSAQESGGSDDENASEESDNDGSVAISEESNSNFQHMRDTNMSQQVKKGICVRNQMSIWENLLEVRIQLQKCLVAANKMPQGDYYKEMIKESDPDLNFKEKVKGTSNSIGNVLDKLLVLQNLVIKKYPETKNLGKNEKKKKGNKDGSDEEIPSDTEDELEHDQSDSEEVESKSPKRRKLNDYESDILGLHEKYKPYRNDTIEKWNTKTRLSVTKNSGQTHSVVNHIEHILTDKEKLRRRTQLKKGNYEILGQEDLKAERVRDSEDNVDIKQVEEYNPEIFDDNDFYHQLLRELIEVKSTDITDPVQLGRQWIQLQNLRSKMKRKIDTRATKGRKIRYAIHTKLVNFMAPLVQQSWTEEAKNELYSSLFGKIQPKRAQLS